jgi:hypothetical protein
MSFYHSIVEAISTLCATIEARHTVLKIVSSDWKDTIWFVRTLLTAPHGNRTPSTICNARRSGHSRSIVLLSCKVARMVDIDWRTVITPQHRTKLNTRVALRPLPVCQSDQDELEVLDLNLSNVQSVSKPSIACICLSNIRSKKPTKSGSAWRGTAARSTLDVIHCRGIN